MKGPDKILKVVIFYYMFSNLFNGHSIKIFVLWVAGTTSCMHTYLNHFHILCFK